MADDVVIDQVRSGRPDMLLYSRTIRMLSGLCALIDVFNKVIVKEVAVVANQALTYIPERRIVHRSSPTTDPQTHRDKSPSRQPYCR